MGLITTLRGRGELPIAPAEIADEVELYARQTDRHAKLRFIPSNFDLRTGRPEMGGTWRVDLDLHPDDPRLKSWQEGRMKRKPVEEIWLHKENPDPNRPWQEKYIPFNIHEMGASGVRQFLERGNIHSGRGEFSSMDDVLRKTAALNDKRAAKRRSDIEDNVRMNARDKRRSRQNIPYLRVGADLQVPTTRGNEK